jgi:hypothetical protein
MSDENKIITYLETKNSRLETENRNLRDENTYLKKKIVEAISLLDENKERIFVENFK